MSTPCNPIDGSPSGSPVPGILQARTLVWVAISFSRDIYTYIHTHAQAYTHSLKLIEGKLKKKLNTVKTSIPSKLIFRFSVTVAKFPSEFLGNDEII